MSKLTGGNTLLKLHDQLRSSCPTPHRISNVLVDKQQHVAASFCFCSFSVGYDLIRNSSELYYFPFRSNVQTIIISVLLSVRSRPSFLSPPFMQYTLQLQGELFRATYHQPFTDCRRWKNDLLRYWAPVGTKMKGRRESFHPDTKLCYRGTSKQKLGKTYVVLIRDDMHCIPYTRRSN